MYHEQTYREIQRRNRSRVVLAVLAVALLVVLAFAANVAAEVGRDQGAVTLRESVLEAAKQCCAVEGSYPAQVSHLEQRYGLVVNHSLYDVRYEWLGDNVLPSVVVTLR